VENEQLVSEKWVNAAHQSSSSNENYGYMWWMNKSEAWKGVSDVYFAAGFGKLYRN
jgi:hypothetical protein